MLIIFCQKHSKNLSSKYSADKLFNNNKKLKASKNETDALETASKREIQKTAKTIGKLIANKRVDNITRTASRNASSESKRFMQTEDKTRKEIYIPTEKRNDW